MKNKKSAPAAEIGIGSGRLQWLIEPLDNWTID
jgi:hypothetical protein